MWKILCFKTNTFLIPVLVAEGMVICLSGVQDWDLRFVLDLLKEAQKFGF